MAKVQLKNAVKRFGRIEVIHDIDLELEHGEFVVFVGPSGCGKSTLLRMIAGLEELSGGDVFIDNENVTHTAAVDRGIAMVFQSYALYPHMSVAENMGFGLKMNGVEKSVIAEKVNKAADTLQLQELLDRKPKNLSGGQRQRVAIGRAIVRDPKVFLFDEPLSNLDAELRVEMRLQIAKLHKQLDATMIYVTHDQVEAMTMADKIVVLRAGRVEQVGSPMQLYQKPANLFVAGFIGSPKMNFLSGVIQESIPGSSKISLHDNQVIQLPIDTQRVEPGSTVTIGLRPEDLNKSEGDFTLPMQVEVAERLGGATYLYGACVDVANFVIERDGTDTTEAGQNVSIGVQADKAYLFDTNGIAF